MRAVADLQAPGKGPKALGVGKSVDDAGDEEGVIGRNIQHGQFK